MTTATDPRISARAAAEAERVAIIAEWRRQARKNLRLGFLDLARLCETRAANLEWETVPCDLSC